MKEDLINLVRTSSLWPRDRVIRYARNWIDDHNEGHEFLSLKGSQTEALWQSVCRSATLEEFDASLEEFFAGNPERGKRGVVARGKKNTPWVRGNGKILTHSLHEALEKVVEDVTEAGMTEVQDPHNQAYRQAREILADECPSRQLEIRLAFLKTLLLLHRTQDYRSKQEGL